MRTCFVLMGVIATIAVSCSKPQDIQFNGENALQLVSKQLQFGPRIPGSGEHWLTGNWIIETLQSYGWVIEEQIFEYQGTRLRNIIAKFNPDGEETPVLLGAHYDTRPFADRDELKPNAPVPGANDGASGVAVLLELARVLSFQQPHQNVWLTFFDAEDSGGLQGWDWIVGSTYFVSELNTTPRAVIVIDMVGDQELELYYEYNSDTDLQSQLWNTAVELGFHSFIPELKHSVLDDHIPFVWAGFSAIDIIDLDYLYWHTTEDTLDKVSARSLEEVGRTILAWIESLP